MTDPRIPSADRQKLRHLLAGSTPGVWKTWATEVMSDQDGTSTCGHAVPVATTHYRDEAGRPRTNDADLICAMRRELPGLLDDLDAERNRANALEEELLRKVDASEDAARADLRRTLLGLAPNQPVMPVELSAELIAKTRRCVDIQPENELEWIRALFAGWLFERDRADTAERLLKTSERHHEEHHAREEKMQPRCVACESQPNDVTPCECAHAPCVHDTNRERKRAEAAETREREAVARADRLAEASREAGVHPVNQDTCGVCGKHFDECEDDTSHCGDGAMFPSCAGARIRAELNKRGALGWGPRVTGVCCLPNGSQPTNPVRTELPDFLVEVWEKNGRPKFQDATNPYDDVRFEPGDENLLKYLSGNHQAVGRLATALCAEIRMGADRIEELGKKGEG